MEVSMRSHFSHVTWFSKTQKSYASWLALPEDRLQAHRNLALTSRIAFLRTLHITPSHLGYCLLKAAAWEPAQVAGSPDAVQRIIGVPNGQDVAALAVARHRLRLLGEVFGPGSEDADPKPTKTFMLRSGQVKAI